MNQLSTRGLRMCLTVVVGMVTAVFPAVAEESQPIMPVSGTYWRAEIGAAGVFQKLETSNGLRWHAVPISSGRFAGPAWVVQGTDVPLKAAAAANRFEGRAGDLSVWLCFVDRSGVLALVAGIRNEGKMLQPALQAGLRLGLDLTMGNGRLLPAVLRCEKTHFWGGAAAPDGVMLGFACPTPVASWHIDRDEKGIIQAVILDLLCPGPLPDRYPKKQDSLAPGETREWTISLLEVDRPADMKQRLSLLAAAPMIGMERCTQEAGPAFRFTIFSPEQVSVSVRPPKGDVRQMRVLMRKPGEYFGEFRPIVGKDKDPYGQYTLVATDSRGQTAEALFYVRRPWPHYLQGAWKEALAKPQKASPDAATWAGLFTEYRAMHYLVDLGGELQSRSDISEIVALLWDAEMREPRFPAASRASRAALAALFAERYSYNQEKEDLRTAIHLFDELATNPSPAGVGAPPLDFATGQALFRVLNEERRAGADDVLLKESYDRHLAFLRRAMDELASKASLIAAVDDPGGTSALLARFAGLQRESADTAKYRNAALTFAAAQRSLAQLAVPDCRVSALPAHTGVVPRGIKGSPDLLCISAANVREIYAAWHLYLLTGEDVFLWQALEGIGSCCQLLDTPSGELRFAYLAEPAVTATLFEEDPARPGMGKNVARQLGECYLPMIGGWYKPAGECRTSKPGEDGFCMDNSVHDIFAGLEEIALTTAYVADRPDGTLVCWNCTVSPNEAGEMVLLPTDRYVVRMHLNLLASHSLRIKFAAGTPPKKMYPVGMSWTGPGGVPESLRVWGEDAAASLESLR